MIEMTVQVELKEAVESEGQEFWLSSEQLALIAGGLPSALTLLRHRLFPPGAGNSRIVPRQPD